MRDSRRKFMKGFGSLIGVSAFSSSYTLSPARLPLKSEADYSEAYWQLVKNQFSIRKDFVMMNAANLCPCPHQVSEAVRQCNRLLEEDVSFQNRTMFNTLQAEAIEALAGFLNADEDEVIITRNTSESNNIVVNGLDFGKGDEVLLWEQNHPTNLIAWQERARRMGFSVKVIALSEQPTDQYGLVEAFEKAISSKTRLLAFSHISNVSGLKLPAAEICRMARSKGVLSLVDGAQSFGFADIDLQAMNCDFYTGSAHKWLMGPKETGCLYIKKENIHRLWPNMIAAGYDGDHPEDINRLASFGQRHEASLAGLVSILSFHHQVGKSRVEQRTLELCAALRENIDGRINNVTWVTPEPVVLRGGVLILKIPGHDHVKIFRELYEKHQIACAPTGGIRLSPHIYNTMEDVNRVADALATLVG